MMNDMMNEHITNCDRCPRKCPLTNVQCGRGGRLLAELQDQTVPEDRSGREAGEEGMRGHGHGRHRRPWERLDGEDELSILLGRCGHTLYHRPSGGRGQGRILKILTERGEVTQKELQERLGIQPGSASEIISKLESRGLVSRERDEHDRRKVVLKITEAGNAGVMASSDEKNDRNLYEALSGEEQEMLKGLLKKLLDSWYPQGQ